MATVKTFRIDYATGVPDTEIRDFITFCEKTSVVRVETLYIPPYGTVAGKPADPRIVVVVTKLDDTNGV